MTAGSIHAGEDGTVTGPRDVLVVDDEAVYRDIVRGVLADTGYRITAARSGKEALATLRHGLRGVVLLDLHLPDTEGLELFDSLQAAGPDTRIIVMTGDLKLDSVVNATRAGAFDFISKDEQFNGRVLISTRNAFASLDQQHQVATLARTLDRGRRFPRIIGTSVEMERLIADIDKLSQSKVSLLIQGASGTGKEVVARSIHESGPRAQHPFVAVNCAGIPDTLLESELFGFERGAFTGAVARKVGKFEVADGGTILLDEIGEMSLPLQAKLLRVLQDGCFERLGSNQPVAVDVRVISATNRDLSSQVVQELFRKDLYYRLAVFTLPLPDLKNRPADIAPLVAHFIAEACREESKGRRELRPEVMRLFLAHPWPGNVRQLQNVVKHAVVVSTGTYITIKELPESFVRDLPEDSPTSSETERRDRLVTTAPPATDSATRSAAGTSPIPLADVARQSLRAAAARSWTLAGRIDAALEVAFPDGARLPSLSELELAGIRLAQRRLADNRTAIAAALDISRATLYRRLQQIDVEAGKRTSPTENGSHGSGI